MAPGDQPDVLVFFAEQAHDATDGGRAAIGRHSHPGRGGVVHSYEEALNAPRGGVVVFAGGACEARG